MIEEYNIKEKVINSFIILEKIDEDLIKFIEKEDGPQLGLVVAIIISRIVDCHSGGKDERMKYLKKLLDCCYEYYDNFGMNFEPSND